MNPFRCRVWTQHSRPEEQLTAEACSSLLESIGKHGQHQPALGRPVTDHPDFDVEIICGARRHAAALALGRELLVDVRTISDADAYVAMYEENAERKDDCPYIQGQILRRALLSRACCSQEDLARVFNLSHSKVSRLLMIAHLPSVILAAFHSPEDIRESWGVALYQVWQADAPKHSIASRARALSNSPPRSSAREIYDLLINTPCTKTPRARLNRSMPICGTNGKILFREEERLGSISFTIPKSIIDDQQRTSLKHALVRILDLPAAARTGEPRSP